ncbi:hypothetical protein WICMUC_004502 [Wickerhamomyces mucosus]|uniref:Uncharacterized protein n=1 Tax=Wickerhamomyces mucosus TaxID=1378264 RepID=A0A9P8PI83_9ASCO|nr:hypothetical protein WICMUC_004502 [Wickerhamomyces mucosus]
MVPAVTAGFTPSLLMKTEQNGDNTNIIPYKTAIEVFAVPVVSNPPAPKLAIADQIPGCVNDTKPMITACVNEALK